MTERDIRAETMKSMNKPLCFFFFIIINLLLSYSWAADHESLSTRTSIVFATFGRSSYAFDIYTLPIQQPNSTQFNPPIEFQITDGHSVNYNGHFPSPSSTSTLLSLTSTTTPSSPPPLLLIYVTERNGSSSLFLDALYYDGPDITRKRSTLQIPTRVQVPLLITNQPSNGLISMKDKPSLVGDYLIYVSTHEDSGVPRTSWAAVYSTQLKTGLTRRLTPYGVADFSPAVSPSGVWTAVASSGERGWRGEVEELDTDVYVFRTEDGSDRVKVVDHGGWPSWADDSTLYFHRRSEDGWWSVYRASLPKDMVQISVDSVVTQRVTPPGLHAFTPAASVANKNFIAVATRRPDSEFRHIELFDVASKEFTEVTRPVSPNYHHLNPFISPDSTLVGYHRCRGSDNGRKGNNLLLENIQSPLPEISLFRIDGSFPSFSPTGDRIAYVKFPGLYVVKRDGSGLRQVFTGTAFATAWDPKRKGVVYTSVGPTFGSESTKVDVISINVDDDEESSYKKLTTGGENNAFPSPSPDGKWLVFRSGRSGHKNLYGFVCGSEDLDSSGLSSSAAVGIAYLLAFESANNLAMSPAENIEYDRLIENEYLGLKNGILDQSAILLSSYGCLTCMNCKTKEHKLVHPPKFQNHETGIKKAYKVLLAFSGLKQALTSNPGYNHRVAECQAAARFLLKSSGNEGMEPLLSNVEPRTYETHKCKLEPSLARRAEHYFSENMRVIKGLEAWASGNLEDFGKLISASGLSSIQNYECGCEPLIQLYEILLRAPGVYGARFSGAGFRGCCIAFVDANCAIEAASFVRNEYKKLQPKLASQINQENVVLICDTADCACVI